MRLRIPENDSGVFLRSVHEHLLDGHPAQMKIVNLQLRNI